jgi:hypothetical protein
VTSYYSELARVAYRAYGETTGFKNFRGDPMPDFDSLGDQIQQAWMAAANAVERSVSDLDRPPLGILEIATGPDGSHVITRADPLIGVSLGLLAQESGADGTTCMARAGGLVTFAGVGTDGRPYEVVYREIGFNSTANPEANDGGFLLLERIDHP